ncbi:uncharacterized protein PV09_00824 [Verruconis gallopava]|uniref:SCP2 domain-containing protein n=1 Tax=Verruconis gallopava TaxID=253628 RepID=A0A0D2AQV6_9PEZI|nr:uncharacterized protein PV09_00824 [Verruconis gallopava]KIW08905.1 hypothetical protein PV09_00824 [Verruconis gallopava]
MGLADPAFASSAAFDAIQAAINDNPKEKAQAIKTAGTIFGFTLKNKEGKTASWHVDLKKTGNVGTGEAPAGEKADVILLLSDEDFGKLLSGTGNPQSLFMSGKLKVRGDIMKATKLQPVLGLVQTKAKL